MPIQVQDGRHRQHLRADPVPQDLDHLHLDRPLTRARPDALQLERDRLDLSCHQLQPHVHLEWACPQPQAQASCHPQ